MSKIGRRRAFQAVVALALAGLIVGPNSVLAQPYPTRPVKLIAPYSPGGATDIMARVIGQWLSERLGVGFIIENRPGGGANIGTEAVIRSAPDGYTLLLASSANAVNATLFPNLKFEFIRDTASIGSIGFVPNVLLTLPLSPAKTTAELVAHLKANPGKVSMGLPGLGSPQHLSAELLKMLTGVDPVFVQYRGGGSVMNDLIGGHVQTAFGSSIASAEYIKAGTLRALGVTSAKRSETFPDVPTIGEAVPGYEASNFYGLSAPKGTPDEIVARLSKELSAGLQDTQVKARLASLGVEPHPMTPVEFGAHIAAETEKWGKVVKSAGLKPE